MKLLKIANHPACQILAKMELSARNYGVILNAFAQTLGHTVEKIVKIVSKNIDGLHHLWQIIKKHIIHIFKSVIKRTRNLGMV